MSENHTEHAVALALTIPEQPASPSTYLDGELNCASLKQRLEAFQFWLAEAFNGGISAEVLIAARSHTSTNCCSVCGHITALMTSLKLP